VGRIEIRWWYFVNQTLPDVCEIIGTMAPNQRQRMGCGLPVRILGRKPKQSGRLDSKQQRLRPTLGGIQDALTQSFPKRSKLSSESTLHSSSLWREKSVSVTTRPLQRTCLKDSLAYPLSKHSETTNLFLKGSEACPRHHKTLPALPIDA
jgi:hypothetical protein